MSDPTDKEQRAQRTLQRTMAVLDEQQTSSFPEIIRLVHTLAQQRNNITIRELAALLEKDPNILVKILRVANSLGYRTGSLRITSVDQAVQVVGFNCVCSIAMAMMLLEQSAKPGSDVRREASSMALCAGTFAQALPSAEVDPSLVFICASLRHFGKIIAAMEMEDEYREVRAMVGAESEEEAFEQVFGITSQALTTQLLSQRHLPEEILSLISGESNSPAAAISDFAAKLSSIVCDQRLSAAEFEEQSRKLASTFAGQIPDLEAQLPTVLTTAGDQLHDLKRSLGITSLPAVVVDRVKRRAAHQEVKSSADSDAAKQKSGHHAPVESSGGSGSTSPVPPSSGASVAVPSTPSPPVKVDRETEILLEGLEEVRRLIAASTPVVELCTAVLDVMQSMFAANESCLFLAEGETCRIVHGAGRAWRRLKPVAAITPGERTVFGLCLEKNTTVLIHDVGSASHIPDWLKGTNLIEAFAALPLKGASRVGILLVGWTTRKKIFLSPQHSELIRKLLALVSEQLG
jgi:HD-like signal output (HDOD) protein